MKNILSALAFIGILYFVLPTSSPSDVTYRVTGTTSFFLTYTTKDGGTAQISSVKENWNYSFTAPAGQFVYVSAQNQSKYGEVKCEILVNDKVVEQTVSYGAYVIATCSGLL